MHRRDRQRVAAGSPGAYLPWTDSTPGMNGQIYNNPHAAGSVNGMSSGLAQLAHRIHPVFQMHSSDVTTDRLFSPSMAAEFPSEESHTPAFNHGWNPQFDMRSATAHPSTHTMEAPTFITSGRYFSGSDFSTDLSPNSFGDTTSLHHFPSPEPSSHFSRPETPINPRPRCHSFPDAFPSVALGTNPTLLQSEPSPTQFQYPPVPTSTVPGDSNIFPLGRLLATQHTSLQVQPRLVRPNSTISSIDKLDPAILDEEYSCVAVEDVRSATKGCRKDWKTPAKRAENRNETKRWAGIRAAVHVYKAGKGLCSEDLIFMRAQELKDRFIPEVNRDREQCDTAGVKFKNIAEKGADFIFNFAAQTELHQEQYLAMKKELAALKSENAELRRNKSGFYAN